MAVPTWASGDSYLSLDVGAYVDNIAQRLSAPSGFAGDVSTLAGFVGLRKGFKLGRRLTLEPDLAMLVPWRGGADGFAKTFTFQLDLELAVDVFSFLALRAGPGMQAQITAAVGQSVQLSNGTSTSTFYVPGGITGIFLFTIGGGSEIKISSRVSMNLDFWASDVGSSTRRRYQGAVSLGYRL